MTSLTFDDLQSFRSHTFRLQPGRRLRNLDDALDFVNERGFVYFWPIKGIIFPSLWSAVAGDRPVADAHDDPGHVTWGWKDEMLDKRRWYYAKLLRGKATMIALDIAPYYYALSENFGDPENDYRYQYQDGLLSREAMVIFETLMREGPLNTLALRKAAHMSGRAGKSPFERALVALQRDFKILPVGVARAGGWNYSFIYDLVHRFYRELPDKARAITRPEAREKLAGLYFNAVGASTAADLRKLFQWRPAEVDKTLQRLTAAGRIQGGVEIKGLEGETFAAVDLFGR